MKRRLYLIILLAAVAFSGMAQNIGEAFYIYRNDGQFNAFFRDEVQSIEYSYEDAEGNTYDEIVTQIVTTADSIYKIPLAAIDSVGFVHPETIYKDNAIPMEGELMDYLVCVDGLTLTFMPTLPNSLTPQEGTKLVELGLTDIFPHGFLGNVSKVIKTSEEITVKCDSIMLEDAVSRFYGSYKLEGKKSSKSRRAAYIDTYHKSLNLEPFSKKISLSDLVAESEVMELSVDNSIFEINAKRFVDIFLTISIDDRLEIDRYDAHIETTLDSEVKYDFCGGISGGPSVEVAIPDIPIVPGITFYMHPGAKLEGTGEVALGFTWTPVLEHVLNLEIYPKDLLKSKVTKNALNLQDSHFDWRYLAGTATFKTAATLELGFGLGNSNFIKVGGELDFGIKEDINYTFNIEDLSKDKKNQVYNLIYDMNKIDLTMYLGTYFVVSALGDDSPWNIAWKPGKDWDLLKIYEGRFFPSFDNVTIKRDEANSHIINAGSDISNDCFLPVTVGYILFDSDDNYIDTWYKDDANYWNRISSFHRYEHQFNGIDLTKSYKVYPCIKIFDKYDMIASPYAELKPISAKVVKFNMTKVQYSKAAFVNDNQNYDFCYNAAITVELENTESVEDWGYVYEDPDKKTKHISLMGNSSPYTATNYAFYRNEPQSTCCLYGYVRYEGDDQYYYSEKVEYPLIYDKQPEATTLGVVEVGQTTAKVKCGYKEAAPWGGVCGIEYWEDTNTNNSKKIYFETAQEEIEVLLTDLNPGKDYYYQAFIMIGEEFIMAEEIKSFTTTPHFVISSGEAINIETSSATLVGTIENEYPADERVKLAFFYSTDENVMNSVSGKSILATYNSNGMLTANISGLNDFTTYYYTLAVKWDDEEFVPSNIMSFKTNPMVTTIENPEATVVSATLQGTCSKGINITGFSIKKDGDTEYTQYSAEVDGEGNFSTTIDGLDLETKYYYYAFVQADGITYKGAEYSFTTKPLCPNDKHPHMIDLGLPSGKKWACCNIGATTPEGYGDYYAWGETSPKSHYDWTNYIYGTGEDGRPEDPDNTNYTKYCNNSEYGLNGFSDGKVTLEESDDAATVNWGNGWRMPLMNEQQELVEKCDWSKVSLNGIKGRLVVGPSKKAIFLPAAGFKYNYYPNDTGEPGVYGHYWSASIDTTVPANNCQAADMNFQNDVIIEWRYYRGSRCAGESVRAVHE